MFAIASLGFVAVSQPAKLPRGRHGLTREEVVGSQRERMLRGMAEAVAAHGYAKTSVAEVLRRAGVSRETFYENYTNKEECFLAAYDAAAELLLGTVGEIAPATADVSERDEPVGPVEQIDAMLARYLELLAHEPAIARTFLVEVYAAGQAALARRVEVQRRFVAAMAALVDARTARQRFACEMLVAATTTLATLRVCADETAELPDLHGPLMDQIVTSLSAGGLLG